MSMKDRMREQGYSKEDEYFFKKDQELLAGMREAADARKKEVEEAHREQPYWMKCPKCGGQLREESLREVVKVDRCSGCNGIYFDDGELDLFVKSARG
jgi:Zn-finger nucleic acid-binding protein